MFETVVRGNVRVSEATSFGTTVFEHAPNSTGAKAYRDLTEEVMSRLNEKTQ
jgi:chromosome partitioning protein